jgi:hypothetical protein|tara:strand:+ start:1382 stop:1510 length:129 start_codon:yes stop_codon:yes gene_type:complete
MGGIDFIPYNKKAVAKFMAGLAEEEAKEKAKKDKKEKGGKKK